MTHVAWQTLRSRWSAFVGTFVALAFGVALLTTMGLVLAASSAGVHDGLGRYAEAPVIVRSEPDLSVPDSWGSASVEPLAQPDGLAPSLVAALDRAVGTQNVVPDRTFYAQTAAGPSGQVGHPWSAAAFGGYRLLRGSAPTGDGDVVIPATEGIASGSSVIVVTAQGPATYTVSGVVAQVPFESAVFFSDAVAARLSPPVDALVVHASDTAVRAVVGDRAQVLSGDQRAQANPQAQQDADELVGVSTMLGLAAGVGGFVAVFVVGSTFAFSVGQRRRELALLRVSGATPAQIRGLVRGEALLVGAGSGAIGCTLGLVCAPFLARWMVAHALAPASFRVGASLNDLFVVPVAFGIGLLLAVLGASLAAVRAGRISPVEALREARATPHRRSFLLRMLPAVAALGFLAAAAMVGSALLLPPEYWADVAPILAMTFVACGMFLLPALVPLLTKAATLPLLRGRGALAQLVRANSLAAAYRTAATVAPVFVTVGLFCCLWSAEASVQNAAQHEASAQAANSDYVVVPQYGKSLSAAAVASVDAVPGAEAAALTPTTVYSVPGHNLLVYPDGAPMIPFQATAVEPRLLADGAVTLPVVSGSVTGLDDSSIIVDQSWNRRVGDKVTVWLADGGQHTFTVAAVIKASIGGSEAYLSDAYAGRALPDVMFVRRDGGVGTGAGSDIGAELDAAIRGRAARVLPTAAWTAAATDTQATQLREALFVVGGIALVYTGIAVANTLVMSTRRRGREFAMLRLAGTTRGQALGLVAGETALVAGIGVLLAAAAVGLTAVGLWVALAHLVGGSAVVLPVLPFVLIAGACTLVALPTTVISAHSVLRPTAVRLAAAAD